MQSEKQHHNCKYDWDLYWDNIMRMKSLDLTWDRISKTLGIPVGAIRGEWIRRDGSSRRESVKISDQLVRDRLAQRAPDTRDTTQRFFGDPRPGESALDRRQA